MSFKADVAALEADGKLWMYDASLDEVRAVTQKDIAAFQVVANAYGTLKEDVLKVLANAKKYERENNPYSPEFKSEQGMEVLETA